MTPKEWHSLQVGDQVIYSAIGPWLDYTNTICEVTSITPTVALTIINPGYRQHTTWGNGRVTADSWGTSDYYKFTRHNEKESLETRIINKIKTLDRAWTQTQIQKGNKNALLRL